MPAFELEQAIRQLEETTATLLTGETPDLLALCQALDRRAQAITKIALLSEEAHGGADGVERLARALAEGGKATRKLIEMRRQMCDEFARLKHLQGAVAPGPEIRPGLDWRG
jgi:hypothetical protein